MNAVELEALSKSFRRRFGSSKVAVDGLTLEVPAGDIYGFLGPNGSGKTTTIRCMLGLVRPSAGTCRVLGAAVPGQLEDVMGRVGSIVETPTFFAGFTGRENLDLLARIGGVPGSRVEAVLERVGLGEAAHDRVRTYSLGMKQRLGLAAVLLKDPELLVLDEPANGLDPAGLKEVRDLLRSLAAEGRTVFLSSHLLHEVQTICDSVAIVAHGRCIAQGPVEEVLRVRHGNAFVVRSPKIRQAKAVLKRAGFASTFGGDQSLRVVAPPGHGSAITKALADAGIYLAELCHEEISLEAVFLELTGS